MSVYFVYRSHYEGPSGKHVRVLDGDSVLGWFQSAWERAKAADDIGEWLKAELGCDVYGLASIFEAARDESLPPPKTDRKLKSYLEEHLYVEGEILFDPHAIQVFTDDDEIELAYFLFDDHYLRDNPGRAAYLLHEGRELPRRAGIIPTSRASVRRKSDPLGMGLGLPTWPSSPSRIRSTSPTSTWQDHAGSMASDSLDWATTSWLLSQRDLAAGVEASPIPIIASR